MLVRNFNIFLFVRKLDRLSWPTCLDAFKMFLFLLYMLTSVKLLIHGVFFGSRTALLSLLKISQKRSWLSDPSKAYKRSNLSCAPLGSQLALESAKFCQIPSNRHAACECYLWRTHRRQRKLSTETISYNFHMPQWPQNAFMDNKRAVPSMHSRCTFGDLHPSVATLRLAPLGSTGRVLPDPVTFWANPTANASVLQAHPKELQRRRAYRRLPNRNYNILRWSKTNRKKEILYRWMERSNRQKN